MNRSERLKTMIAFGCGLLLAACGDTQDKQASVLSQGARAPGAGRVARPRSAPPIFSPSGKIDGRLAGSSGLVEVWVSLDQPSLATVQSKRATELGIEPVDVLRQLRAGRANAGKSQPAPESGALTTIRAEVDAQRPRLEQQQQNALDAMKGLGASELGRVSRARNSVAVRLDASKLETLSGIAGVLKVSPVLNYQLNVGTTVPYVGGTAVQNSGFDGAGVTIAVIDSGIDYTHRNLGGPGTTAAYAEASADISGSTQSNAWFPNSKVVGGYDFVGDSWTGAPDGPAPTESPNPIDRFFHGTQVADIAAGASLDGLHQGMAPGAKLLALKACSAAASGGCPGVSMLKALDYALDPNGDGNFDDAADVINLSSGSPYGQPGDELSLALGQAVELGVVVVSSAGNSGNLPTAVTGPSSEPGVISVAETQMPDAKTTFIDIDAPQSLAQRILPPDVWPALFTHLTERLTGDVVYVGRGCSADPVSGTAEDPYLVDPRGKIALVDFTPAMGCPVLTRLDHAGAKAVIFGHIDPGPTGTIDRAPGSPQVVPTFLLSQVNSDAIKSALAAGQAVSLSFDVMSLAKSMSPTSSRGPSSALDRIKPEIGAPGTSISARVGSGTGEQPFGGTSGAAPMVAGAAAQLLQAFPDRTPLQIKAMLMNTAATDVALDPLAKPGVLAPITLIGAGELRVDRALSTTLIAFNAEQRSAALSFGFQAVAHPSVFRQQLVVQNLGDTRRIVKVTGDFRYQDDEASAAVKFAMPSEVVVRAHDSVKLPIVLTVDPDKLPAWQQDGTDLTSAGATFSNAEYDGYITLSDDDGKITVPWHIIPRKASDLRVRSATSTLQPIVLTNVGSEWASTEVYALTGTSPELPPNPSSDHPIIDLRAVGVHLFGAGTDFVEFGISTYGRRSNPITPAEFDVKIDVNRDGQPDFIVYNGHNYGPVFASAVLNLAEKTEQPGLFGRADLYSGNVVLTVPLSMLGLTETSTFDFSVDAVESRQSGAVTDRIGTMTFTPGTPRFALDDPDQQWSSVAPGAFTLLRVRASAAGSKASPSQTGLLFLHFGNAGPESAIATLER